MEPCVKEEELKDIRHAIVAIEKLTTTLELTNEYSGQSISEIRGFIKEQNVMNGKLCERVMTLEFEVKDLKKSQVSTEVQVKDILDSNTIRTDKEITSKVRTWLPTGLMLALILALFGLIYAVQNYMSKAMEILNKP